MSAEQSRVVVSEYLARPTGVWLSVDVELEDVPNGIRCRGRSAVNEWMRALYRSFADATVGPVRLVTEGDVTVAEVLVTDSVGPTDQTRATSAPMVVACEVRAGEIVALRLYYDRQMVAGGAPSSSLEQPRPRGASRTHRTSGPHGAQEE